MAVLVRLVLFGLPAERTELLARVAAVALRRRLRDAAAAGLLLFRDQNGRKSRGTVTKKMTVNIRLRPFH